LLISGCDPGQFVEASFEPPAEAAGDFELFVDEVDRPDRVFGVEVVGAPAGADIVLIVTDASEAAPPCPAGLEPTCLTIEGEQVLELRSVVDEDGEAWWYVPFGAAGSDGRLKVQAFTETETPWISNGLRLRVP
jgi:hypothetical protein